MDFKENDRTVGNQENFDRSESLNTSSNSLKVKRTPEYDEEDGAEQAFGLFSKNTLLAVCWNEELAQAFKETADKIYLQVINK